MPPVPAAMPPPPCSDADPPAAKPPSLSPPSSTPHTQSTTAHVVGTAPQVTASAQVIPHADSNRRVWHGCSVAIGPEGSWRLGPLAGSASRAGDLDADCMEETKSKVHSPRPSPSPYMSPRLRGDIGGCVMIVTIVRLLFVTSAVVHSPPPRPPHPHLT